MALTDKSDFYVAVHEDGINIVVKQLMRQRPSLVNYGTALLRAQPELLCESIEAVPGVTRLITVLPPIPLLGTEHFAFNYCFQLTDLRFEFHPGNVIELPSELEPPLAKQLFAFQARVCGGLGCPSKGDRPLFEPLLELDRFVIERTLSTSGRSGTTVPNGISTGERRLFGPTGLAAAGAGAGAGSILENFGPSINLPFPPQGPAVEVPTTHVFPTRELSCFCLEALATGQGTLTGSAGNQTIGFKIDDLEVVDLTPDGIEKSFECYILLVLNQVILRTVNDAISNVLFRMIDFGELGSIKFTASTGVSQNPAIEENQLKAFIDLAQFGLDIPPIVVEEGEDGDGDSGDVIETEIARTRSGPFHLTAAVSEKAFIRIFEAIRDNTVFDITIEPQGILPRVRLGAIIKFHLDEGRVEFDDNMVKIEELDIKWDQLDLFFSIDLPKLCFPPFPLCLGSFCLPQWCVFEGENHIPLPVLSIPTIFTSEVSANLRPKITYETSSEGNHWKVAIVPIGPVDIDIIDVSATIGDALNDLIEGAVNALDLPDVAEEVLEVILDNVVDILDFGDDVQEWIKEQVFDAIGLELGIDNLVAKLIKDKFEVLSFEDPIEVLGGDDPVRIPIEFIGATVDKNEITIGADVEE